METIAILEFTHYDCVNLMLAGWIGVVHYQLYVLTRKCKK